MVFKNNHSCGPYIVTTDDTQTGWNMLLFGYVPYYLRNTFISQTLLFLRSGISGLVVECSPAMRAALVRFPTTWDKDATFVTKVYRNRNTSAPNEDMNGSICERIVQKWIIERMSLIFLNSKNHFYIKLKPAHCVPFLSLKNITTARIFSRIYHVIAVAAKARLG